MAVIARGCSVAVPSFADMGTRQSAAEVALPEQHLHAVLQGLPRTAAALHTLMTVGPDARQPLFRHVGDAAAQIDDARVALMATVSELPQYRRGAAIRVAQTASLLGSLMVAVARVAAQGRPEPLPAECRRRAHAIVGLTDRAVITLPRQRIAAAADDDEAGMLEPDAAVVLPLLTAASVHLDRLMVVLTGGPPHWQ